MLDIFLTVSFLWQSQDEILIADLFSVRYAFCLCIPNYQLQPHSFVHINHCKLVTVLFSSNHFYISRCKTMSELSLLQHHVKQLFKPTGKGSVSDFQ